MSYWKPSLSKGFSTIVALIMTFMLAILLSLVQLPHQFKLVMPNWVALVLIYWIVFVPKLLGVKFAFILGVLIDLTLGNIVGTTSLCLVPIAFFAELFCYKFKTFSILHQFLMISVLIGISQLIRLWIQLYMHHPPSTATYWLSIPLSVLFWPLVWAGLHLFNKVIINFVN